MANIYKLTTALNAYETTLNNSSIEQLEKELKRLKTQYKKLKTRRNNAETYRQRDNLESKMEDIADLFTTVYTVHAKKLAAWQLETFGNLTTYNHKVESLA